jgi:Uma2 family endonuclease
LCVEIADTAAQRHRHVEIPLDARHGIPEAWLVDVTRTTVTVFRDRRDGDCSRQTEHGAGTVSPRGRDAVSIGLKDLFG